LRYAKVFVVVHQGDARHVVEGLQAARGYLRRLVGTALRAKAVPELSFAADEQFEHGQKMERLLAEIGKGEGSK
jgi:ribosome-binding factor A